MFIIQKISQAPVPPTPSTKRYCYWWCFCKAHSWTGLVSYFVMYVCTKLCCQVHVQHYSYQKMFRKSCSKLLLSDFWHAQLIVFDPRSLIWVHMEIVENEGPKCLPYFCRILFAKLRRKAILDHLIYYLFVSTMCFHKWLKMITCQVIAQLGRLWCLWQSKLHDVVLRAHPRHRTIFRFTI